MDITIRKYIQKISRANLIFPIILFVIAATLLLLIPFRRIFGPPKASSIEELINLYNDGNKYVEFTLHDLHYTTYDYYTGRKDNTACYYYILDEKNGPTCVFFLIPAQYTENRAQVLDTYSAKATFVSGGDRFETFLSGFSTDIGWNTDALSEISGHFAVSPYDYRPGFYMAILVLLFAVLLVCLGDIVANIVFTVAPHLYPPPAAETFRSRRLDFTRSKRN